MLQRGAPKLGKDGKPVKDKHGKIVYEPYQILGAEHHQLQHKSDAL